LDRKQRLRLIHERNRRHQLVFQHAEQHQQNTDALREAQQDLLPPPPPPSTDEQPVWSARTQEIRSRLNGKRRAARDRFNRFAGTSDAGAMGR